MEKIPLETQTLYAELLDQLMVLEAQRSIGSLPGGFVTKKVQGKTYYYFQYSEPGGERKQVFVGRKCPTLDRLVETFQEQKDALKADQQSIQRLCAQIRIGGAFASPHAHARVLQSLADAGVFRMGGVLVGTHAFAVMGNMLGYRWDRKGIETQDVDIVAERDLDLAFLDFPEADVSSALERLQMGFFPVPSLDPEKPSTSFKVRKSPLRVDVLTPAKHQKEKYQPVPVPKLKTAAQALKYLDYLIEDPQPAAIISANGVLVKIPDPARYAHHKLIVAQERPASEHAKKVKDLRQASLLLTVLSEERPGDLDQAWKALTARGSSWEQKASRGLEEMRRLSLA